MPIISNFPTSNEKSLVFTVELSVEGWLENAQTVSDNPAIVETGYVYTVSPKDTSYDAYSAASVHADDVTVPGQMTFHCKKVPQSPLTVNVVRTEVEA